MRKTRRRLWALVALPAVLVLVLSLGMGSATAARPTVPVAARRAAAAVAAAGTGTYVALGDSYSSGDGNGPYQAAAPSCDRSTAHAWPQLAGTALGIARVTLLACSGATLSSLTGSFRGQPAQESALAALPRPGLVSVTIGGNDLGFTSILLDCLVWDCSADGTLAAATKTLSTLQPRLAAAYAAVDVAGHGAPTLVVGYPAIFPPPGTPGTNCPFWLSPGEEQGLYQLQKALDATTARAAAAAHVPYVTTLTAFAGHELCTAVPDVYGVTTAPGAVPAHPNLAGQQALAAVVASYVRAHHLLAP